MPALPIFPDEIYICIISWTLSRRHMLMRHLHVSKHFAALTLRSIQTLSTKRYNISCDIVSSLPNVNKLTIYEGNTIAGINTIHMLCNLRHLTMEFVQVAIDLGNIPLESLDIWTCRQVVGLSTTLTKFTNKYSPMSLDLSSFTRLCELHIAGKLNITGYEHVVDLTASHISVVMPLAPVKLILVHNKQDLTLPVTLRHLELFSCLCTQVAHLTNLRAIVLLNSKITKLPYSLTKLDLRGTTEITSFEHLTNLRLLCLGRCPLGSPIPNITSLTSLTTLRLLSRVPDTFATFTNLRKLVIGPGKSQMMSLVTLTKLRMLRLLPDADIDDNVLQQMTMLRDLIIESNRISSVSISTLTQLIYLTIPATIMSDFTMLKRIKRINVKVLDKEHDPMMLVPRGCELWRIYKGVSKKVTLLSKPQIK